MLNHGLWQDEGILMLEPTGPLETADFETLTSHVDAYLEKSGILRGVLILAPRFPGWKDFGALLAHLRFVKQHHQKIEKVAVVSDDGVAIVMPHIAQHFIHAQVKHFEPAQESAARDWLIEGNRAQIRTAA